jgi:hypothetical protein
MGGDTTEILHQIGAPKTGQGWAVKTIKEIWKVHWVIWNQRNETLHKTGDNMVLGSKELDKEIEEELRIGSDLVHNTEKYLFRVQMKEVRKWAAPKKKKCLRTVQSARHTSKVRHQATEQPRKMMRDWLSNGKTPE